LLRRTRFRFAIRSMRLLPPGIARPGWKWFPRPIAARFAALMRDLTDRGMLDETLVAMYGEFGRTPTINKNVGRDHWAACQSAVLAGGGIQGGQVYGTTDRDSANPKSNRVSPEDMLATIYHALGIAPTSVMYDRLERPHHVVDGSPLTCLSG